MQVPRLPVTGENLKKYVVETLRSIIAYLNASRIRPGTGIKVDETPCGTVISLASRSVSAQNLNQGGETEVEGGFAISVSGGSGGNPYVVSLNVEAGSNITLSGGTNGNPLIISATGGGGGGGGGLPFPDYAALTTSSSSGTVLSDSTPFTATSNGWLRVSIRNDSNLSDGCFRLILNGADIGFYQYRTNSPGITRFVYIPSGTVVEYSSPSSSTFVKFAPGIGSGLPAPIYTAMTGSGALDKGTNYTIPEDGWIRISIRNDSNLSDGCFRIYFDGVDIGFYQYRTGSCGVTDFLPIQAGTVFRYETSSTSTYVKFDHVFS